MLLRMALPPPNPEADMEMGSPSRWADDPPITPGIKCRSSSRKDGRQGQMTPTSSSMPDQRQSCAMAAAAGCQSDIKPYSKGEEDVPVGFDE